MRVRQRCSGQGDICLQRDRSHYWLIVSSEGLAGGREPPTLPPALSRIRSNRFARRDAIDTSSHVRVCNPLRLHHSRHKVRRGAHSSRRVWHRRRCVWHPLVASRQEGRM